MTKAGTPTDTTVLSGTEKENRSTAKLKNNVWTSTRLTSLFSQTGAK